MLKYNLIRKLPTGDITIIEGVTREEALNIKAIMLQAGSSRLKVVIKTTDIVTPENAINYAKSQDKLAFCVDLLENIDADHPAVMRLGFLLKNLAKKMYLKIV